ncbi:MAG: hypothetical protein NC416_14500 [Eubacterium sp.]|nr:hypothetical protein [Eubacterium sp.]
MDSFGMLDLMNIYSYEDTIEQKVQYAQERFPVLTNVYIEDLKTFFGYTRNQLPIIKGVEVETRWIGSKIDHYYGMITELPEQILPEVQKTIMRIVGCIGFTYKKWGIGSLNETMKKHLQEYQKIYQVAPVLGKDCGYPKVLAFDYNGVDSAPNESYSVTEVYGFVLD